MSTHAPIGHDPIRVGLIGAGPWARAVTGPVFAAGPRDRRSSGVWSRTAANTRARPRPRSASTPYDDVDALIAASDAVAIAVTPDAQPDLAVRAVAAGRPVLLEKPLAGRPRGCATPRRRDRRAPASARSLMLTYRFHPGLPALRRGGAPRFDALGGRGCFLSGAFLPGSPYARGWRLERGALLDVGPAPARPARDRVRRDRRHRRRGRSPRLGRARPRRTRPASRARARCAAGVAMESRTRVELLRDERVAAVRRPRRRSGRGRQRTCGARSRTSSRGGIASVRRAPRPPPAGSSIERAERQL